MDEKEKKEFDEVSELIDEYGDKALEVVDKEIDDLAREQREMELNEAYKESPKKYNELFDDYQRFDREARKENGTYSVDDFLDDLEEQREKDTSRRR